MKTVFLENKGHPLPSPLKAFYCENYLCRLRGLMFRSHLDAHEGLLLVQPRDSRLDSAIHMLFVFMDLAIIWINAEHIVVDTLLARRWRPAYLPRQAARYTLEIVPQRLSEFQIGDIVEFRDA